MNRVLAAGRASALASSLIVCLAWSAGCENRADEEALARSAAPAASAAPASAPAAPVAPTAPTPAAADPVAPAPDEPRELLADAPPDEPQEQPAPAQAPEPAPTAAAAADDAGHYEYRPGSPDGIGKWYMGREISHVMGHEGAGWLERAEREEEERPSKLIEILKKRIGPDDAFADIGAGTGYYSFRIAPLVPQGKVLAVDIQQQMLDIMGQLAKDKDVDNVEPILGTITDPKLPDGGVDWVLLVDAYHEFDHPREMMEALFADLKPGGQIVLLEFRAEDPAVYIKPLHKMTEAQAVKEMEAVGLKHVETLKDLPWQHVMFFEKPRE
jgi:ubiquinone/menaquinone biosynthesis C-methylase UbiE